MTAGVVIRAWAAAASAPLDLPPERRVELPPPGLHRRRARLPTLAVALAKRALGERSVPEQTAVLLGTARGCQTETIAFVEHMIEANEATPKPRAFSASVHNAAAAQVAIALGARGPNQTFVHGALSLLQAIFAARRLAGPALVGVLDEHTRYDDLAREAYSPGCSEEGREGGVVFWTEPRSPAAGEVVVTGVAWGRPRDPEAWLAARLPANAERIDVGGGDVLAPALALVEAVRGATPRTAVTVRSRFGEVGLLTLERTVELAS